MALLRTLDEIVAAVLAVDRERTRATDAGPRTLVGLAGAPGSGKSTVGEALVARHERFGKTAAEARAWALGPDEANARLIERTRGRADHEIRLD